MNNMENLDQSEINNIEVLDAEILTVEMPVNGCRVDFACAPEAMFEMIETCKICGRCV